MPSVFPHRQEFIGKLKKSLFEKKLLQFKNGFPPAWEYSGLNLNQDKVTKPQTVQIVRQGEATPYWFKVNPL